MLTQPLTDLIAFFRRAGTGGARTFRRPGNPCFHLHEGGGQGPAFLLESVTGGENLARYSFIGVNPSRAYVLQGGALTTHGPAGTATHPLAPGEDPLALLEAELARCRIPHVAGLPRFTGGLVGYVGYEMVRRFEPGVRLSEPQNVPEAIFLLADTVIAFDHAFGRLLLIAIPDPDLPAEQARAAAEARLDDIQARLAGPVPPLTLPAKGMGGADMRSNITREEYMEAVVQGKEYIAAGDIFQVVLSQRLSRSTSASAFGIYRALRRLNPSPYMFYFDFGSLAGDPPLQADRCLARNPRAPGGRRGDAAPHRRDAPARENARRRCRPGARPAGRRERARRARHAGGPGPQRPGAGVRVRQRARAGADVGGALLARDAHRLAGGGQAAPRFDGLRPAAGHLPRRNGERGAQGARHADHRRTGKGAARRLRRGGGLFQPPTAAWTPASPSARW